jgi:hypothetical protein
VQADDQVDVIRDQADLQQARPFPARNRAEEPAQEPSEFGVDCLCPSKRSPHDVAIEPVSHGSSVAAAGAPGKLNSCMAVRFDAPGAA